VFPFDCVVFDFALHMNPNLGREQAYRNAVMTSVSQNKYHGTQCSRLPVNWGLPGLNGSKY
jgi:hypothetical protein